MKNSLPTRGGIIAITAILIFATGLWWGYRRRFEIRAWVWHKRHGNYVRFRGYDFDVPARWYESDTFPGGFTLLNANPSPIRASVDVVLGLPNIIDPQAWRSMYQIAIEKSGGQPSEVHNLTFGGQKVACIGSDPIQAAFHARAPGRWISVECVSSRSLHISYVGDRGNLDEFYLMIQQTRESNP